FLLCFHQRAGRQTLSLFWTVNPEGKRRIIGNTFVKEADRTTNDLNLSLNNLLLGQGALRPDFIESASHRAYSRADAIKTHNDSEMVRQFRLHGRVVEPLKCNCIKNYILERHPFPGPGLSIQIIYAEELFMEADFGETQVLIRLMVDYANMAAEERALPNRTEIVTSEEDRFLLEELSSRKQYVATLLSIRVVGVQVQDLRNLNVLLVEFYKDFSLPCREIAELIAPLSSDQTQPNWNDLATYARLIPRVCHNVDRVCYIFGKPVRESVTNVTPTFLTRSNKMVEAVLTVSGIFRVLFELTTETTRENGVGMI
ncbi:putative GMP synthase, partial [Daphnia magna]